MNRSVRARESQVHAVARERKQSASNRMSIIKEKEDDLALFLDMRNREKERNNLLLQNSELDVSGSKPLNASTFSTSSSTPQRRNGVDDFFNSDNDKNDYDWLLTPPGTPLFPSLEMETRKTVMSQICTPKARPSSVLKPRLSGSHDHPPRNNLLPRPSVSSPASLSSMVVPRKPLPSKTTATSVPRPTPAATVRHPRSSTPTSRPTLSNPKPADPPRSSTPTRHMGRPDPPRSSTPTRLTARPSTPVTRPPARSSTPTPRPASTQIIRPASRPKSRPATPAAASGPAAPSRTNRNTTPVRGVSPSAKPRQWNPSEMPGFSLEAPPNLRTSLADRPLSAARGRPGAPSGRSSVEGSPGGRPRRQSCSPSRGRPPNTAAATHSSRSSVPAMGRPHFKADDCVNPVVMGTKMVERVVNMRRLVPSKLEEKPSPLSGKSSSSSPGTGFGRMLSKKSLDMAIRHMDIGRSMQQGGSLHPLMTNIPASSMYSVRSGPARSRTVSISDSPLATSSNASSEVSVNNCGFFFEEEVRSSAMPHE